MTKEKSTKAMLLLTTLLIGLMAIVAFIVPEQTASKINTFFSGILATITLAYMFLTKNILDDSVKSRQITFISKQLEGLYYPLEEVLKRYSVPVSVGRWDEIEDIDTESDDMIYSSLDREYELGKVSNISDLLRKRYLFKEKSEAKELFIEFVDGGHYITNSSSEESLNLWDKLKEKVKEDIGFLELELNKLVSE